MKICKVVALGASVFLLSGATAFAASLNTTTDPGTSWNVDNFAAWYTTGNTMDGMSVTATLNSANGSFTETLFWSDNTGVLSTHNGWSLTLNDYGKNTWFSSLNWTLNNSGNFSISSLVIDGRPGNTVFDTIYIPETTPGSESGRSITLNSASNDNLAVAAEYSNNVGVGLADPLGDIYHTLTLGFAKGTGYNSFFGQESFVFSLDTDNVNDRNPVPEPATLLMFGIGLAGLASARIRKKK